MGKEAAENIDDYDQCYVDVIVYNSTSFKYGLEGATVTILSGEYRTSSYMPFSQGITDSEGKSCIPVECRIEARAFVEKGTNRLFALNVTLPQQHLPEGYSVDLETNNEVLKFYTYA